MPSGRFLSFSLHIKIARGRARGIYIKHHRVNPVYTPWLSCIITLRYAIRERYIYSLSVARMYISWVIVQGPTESIQSLQIDYRKLTGSIQGSRRIYTPKIDKKTTRARGRRQLRGCRRSFVAVDRRQFGRGAAAVGAGFKLLLSTNRLAMRRCSLAVSFLCRNSPGGGPRLGQFAAAARGRLTIGWPALRMAACS